MEIFHLLKDFGVDVDIQDFAPAETEVIQQGYTPSYFRDNIPVFTSQQIDIYGTPDLFGFEEYEVVELAEESSPMVTDWNFEKDRERPRPIHRYDRVERFEFIMAQLLGIRGDVPMYVMAPMEYANKDPDLVWNSIRNILKHYKQRKFYNRIPQIIFRLGLGSVFTWDRSSETYNAIINDFKKLHHTFEYCQKRQKWNRKYFPNMRFIAIKLLERYGAVCNFKIDFIRTKRKRKVLADIWNDFS